MIQGIGIIHDGEPYVYVVTVPGGEDSVHDRTPSVITLEETSQFGEFESQEDWPWQKAPS